MSLRRPALPALLALLTALVCAAAAVALIAYGLTTRPYGVVEAELVFEASRVRHGLPLYVDPAMGAWELGPPPSRYYVLYTPAWPWLLAHAGPWTTLGMRLVGRVVNALLYAGTLAAVVRTARPSRHVVTATAALLVLGFAMLTREATLATADMPAVALATLGLARAIRRGGLDPISAALLATAPLIKPSVLGLVAGSLLAHAVVQGRAVKRSPREWRASLAPLVSGAIVAAGLVSVFHVASDGAWLTHIVRATGQTLSFDRWVQELGGRVLFLGAPHLVVLVVAMRRRTTPLATIPLAVSLAWSCFSMAKHGSGTHYWLEPTMAALLTLGATSSPGLEARSSRLVAWSGLAFVVVAAVVTLRELAESPAAYAGWHERADALRERCALDPGKVLVATDVSLEMEIDGRILVPSWQSSYSVRTGTFPLDAWRRDLALPEVQCFADGAAFLEPQPERIEGITEVNALRRELRDAIVGSFLAVGTVGGDGGLVVYRRP